MPARDALSVVFAALADPTRRAILTQLSQGPTTAGEVVAPSRLVFTWVDPGDPEEDAPVITVTLEDLGQRTRMVFHLDGVGGEPGDENVYDGWDSAFDVLSERLA